MTSWVSQARPGAPSLRQSLPDGSPWRLFVAAPLPDLAATRVWEALAPLRIAYPGVRWLAPDKLHLTLVFLGATDPEVARFLSGAIEATASEHASFDVATGEAGGHLGGHGGGVAWLRLAHGGHQVAQLSLATDDAIGSRIYDDRNAPHPHLTVARGVSERALSDMRALAETIRLEWTVDRVVLLRSHTESSGSRYEVLASSELVG